MENPFIGKKADVYNKMGVVAFLKGSANAPKCPSPVCLSCKPDERKNLSAEQLWDEALKLSDRHFDAKLNKSMCQWSYGLISDQLLMLELSDSGIFEDPSKGKALMGYLLIA